VVNRHLVTLLLLAGAVVCYAAGLALPATGLIVLGVVAELAFWIRLLRPRNR
jgi:hypothetical protein